MNKKQENTQCALNDNSNDKFIEEIRSLIKEYEQRALLRNTLKNQTVEKSNVDAQGKSHEEGTLEVE